MVFFLTFSLGVARQLQLMVQSRAMLVSLFGTVGRWPARISYRTGARALNKLCGGPSCTVQFGRWKPPPCCHQHRRSLFCRCWLPLHPTCPAPARTCPKPPPLPDPTMVACSPNLLRYRWLLHSCSPTTTSFSSIIPPSLFFSIGAHCLVLDAALPQKLHCLGALC